MRYENTDCPNVFTTGTLLTYSTASLDISSRAFWYSAIFFFMFSPIIMLITANASTTDMYIPFRYLPDALQSSGTSSHRNNSPEV